MWDSYVGFYVVPCPNDGLRMYVCVSIWSYPDGFTQLIKSSMGKIDLAGAFSSGVHCLGVYDRHRSHHRF